MPFETIEELQHRMRQFTATELEALRLQCAQHSHAWIDLRTNTFGSGPARYCGRCLILKLTNFEGWLEKPLNPSD